MTYGTIDDTVTRVKPVPKRSKIFSTFLEKDSRNQKRLVNKHSTPVKIGTIRDRSGSREYINP